MPFSDPQQAFKDVLENIGRIERFTDGLDENRFRGNEQTVFAVQYALLVISEAAVGLGEQAQQWAPEQPWRSIRGLGNWLRHGYDRIDPGVLWRTVIDDLRNPVFRSMSSTTDQCFGGWLRMACSSLSTASPIASAALVS